MIRADQFFVAACDTCKQVFDYNGEGGFTVTKTLNEMRNMLDDSGWEYDANGTVTCVECAIDRDCVAHNAEDDDDLADTLYGEPRDEETS